MKRKVGFGFLQNLDVTAQVLLNPVPDFNGIASLTITVPDVLGLEGERTIELYPNPSTDYVSINSTEVRSVSILDLNGKELLSLPVTDQIDISELKAGNYIIKLKDKNDTVIGTDRIIKQ